MDFHGWSAIHYSVFFYPTSNLDLGRKCILSLNTDTNILADSTYQILIKSDITLDVNQRDHRGRSLLMLTISHRLYVYQDLLKRGADARALDDAGNTVLHYYYSNLLINCSHTKGILESPAILELLIRAGADPHHVNSCGQLPHEPPKTRLKMTFPVSIHNALASCIWHEMLRRRSDIDPACHKVSLESSSSELRTDADDGFPCCLFHWRFFSWKQDHAHLESLSFEAQIATVLECWILIEKMMAPFLSKTSLVRNTSRIAKIRESLSELKSRIAVLDRAGTAEVRLFREESKMELYESHKPQTCRPIYDKVAFDDTTANTDLLEVCGRCQRKTKADWEGLDQ